jgi:hypothetical protein
LGATADAPKPLAAYRWQVRINPEGCVRQERLRGLSDLRGQERRASPRTDTSFPATVRGVDATGDILDVETVLDNLSGGGLYVRLQQRVAQGAHLAVGIRLSEAGVPGRAARVAARGVVLRVEPAPDGRFGLAIRFTKSRVF